MASFPGAIVSFSAITSGVTVMQQSLFDELIDEIQAIETELGTSVLGTAGSIVERLNMAMDQDGNARGLIQNFDAANGERKRLRAGKTAFRCADLTSITNNLRGSVTFDVALSIACHVFCMLELVETDPTSATIPCFVAYVKDSGTTTGFDFIVCDSSNDPPAATTGFLLHWIAVEKDFTGTGTGL